MGMSGINMNANDITGRCMALGQPSGAYLLGKRLAVVHASNCISTVDTRVHDVLLGLLLGPCLPVGGTLQD